MCNKSVIMGDPVMELRGDESLPRLEVDSKRGSWSYLLDDTRLLEVSSSINRLINWKSR